MDFLEQALGIAVAAAKEAGKIQLKHYNSGLKISIKGSNPRDMVTNADKEADALIRRLLQESFPDHAIVTEEDEPQKGNEFTWYVDPIDGTSNYIRGANYFCVSIGLARGSELLLGVVYNPLTSETYTAQKGNGSFLNGKRINVAKTGELGSAVVCCDFGYDNERRKIMLRLMEQIILEVKSIRFKGSGALAMCELAQGAVDAYVYPKSSPWDYAAASLIIREAGGKVTDFEGKEWQLDSANVVVTNGFIHPIMLEKIRAALKNG